MTTTQTRPPIPAHQGGVGYRAAAAVATPGGAVFVLAIGLLIAIIVANPNFGDPGVIIRFFGRTAPIHIFNRHIAVGFGQPIERGDTEIAQMRHRGYE